VAGERDRLFQGPPWPLASSLAAAQSANTLDIAIGKLDIGRLIVKLS
jgi:hypothetical protein